MSVVGLDLCKKFVPLSEHDNFKKYSKLRIISKKIQMHILKEIIRVYFVNLSNLPQTSFEQIVDKNVSTLSVNVPILRKTN